MATTEWDRTDLLSDPGVQLALGDVVETAVAIAGADFGNVQLLDPVTGDLRIVAHRGFLPWWLDYWDSVAKGHGACGTALQSGQRVIVEDVERSPIFAGTPALDVQRRAGVRAVQSTPVISRAGAPLGMLSTHYRTARKPDDHALKLLDLLARHVAELVERFQAEEKIRRLNAELERRVAELGEARRQAEHLSRAKSTFLANISHEIRTPMNAVLGMAHLMRKDGLTPKQTFQVERIEHAAEHLLHVINDILDISQIEAGRLTLERTEFGIEDAVAPVVSMVSAKAEEKGLALRTDIEQLPYRVVGDATRLTQALLNYANNAVKFTGKGSVVLRVRVMEEAAERVLLRFEVEDTGIGIAAGGLERLFSPFEQADNSTKREYGGTGLGLAITRRLAQLMGGDAGVSSAQDLGSVFWFTAWFGKGARRTRPSDRAIGTIESPETALARDHAGRRVLLAEDEPVNQMITMQMLSDTGLVVDTADDGLEAVEKAGLYPYDLVLMDVHMPRMDGLEATRQIRGLPGCEAVPIVALTASGFPEDRAKCQAAGMDDFLSKPVLPNDLAATVLNWLSRAAERSAAR